MVETSYIPLSQRGQWSDLAGIPQQDGPNPLVPIMYSEEYRDAMDYFRALAAAGEKSDRALELTETIIRMNPAHYTVWQYRMSTLLELKKDLVAELELMNEFAREQLKSYQVWHHRLLLLTHISPSSPTTEVKFIHAALLPDAKNYHTWAYLHWLYSHFSTLGRITPEMWSAEQAWCDEMIRVDGRNNSAWGWRWFLRFGRPDAEGAKDGGKGEIEYALREVHRIPHNVSAWNYLRGALKHLSLPLSPLASSISPYLAGSAIAPTPDPTSSSWPQAKDPLPADCPLPIPLALEYHADALIEEGRLGDAEAAFAELGDKYDRIRAGYWEYRRRGISE